MLAAFVESHLKFHLRACWAASQCPRPRARRPTRAQPRAPTTPLPTARLGGTGSYTEQIGGGLVTGTLTDNASLKESTKTTTDYDYDDDDGGWLAEDGWGTEVNTGSGNKVYAKVEGIYGIDTDVYNVVGVASDQHSITNSLHVNANLSLDLSAGNWDVSSGSKWSQSTMTDTTEYHSTGGQNTYTLPAQTPGQTWFYTARANESGSTKTVITQDFNWTPDGGSWSTDPTASYYDDYVTSNNSFGFSAGYTYPNLTDAVVGRR